MRLVTAGLLFVLLAACAGGDMVSGDRRTVGVVTVIFSISPAHARVGQPVHLTLRLSNNGGKTEQLTFPSGKHYDFWVRQGRKEIWRWSTDRAFIQTITNVDIATQTSKAFAELWTPASTGRFAAWAEVTAVGYKGAMSGKVIVE